MSPSDIDQVSQVARLVVLAMCARGVLASECEDDSDIRGVRLTVQRAKDGSMPIDAEFLGAGGIAVGGMSL